MLPVIKKAFAPVKYDTLDDIKTVYIESELWTGQRIWDVFVRSPTGWKFERSFTHAESMCLSTICGNSNLTAEQLAELMFEQLL